MYHGEMLAGGVYLGADADVARTRPVAACKDVLTFWKDADLDHPIYRQAKAEYAKLQALCLGGDRVVSSIWEGLYSVTVIAIVLDLTLP